MKKDTLFDVVAVSMETNTVRLIATEKTRDNAEAIVSMAVMRRGVDDEFFGEVPHGMYADGDRWKGSK